MNQMQTGFALGLLAFMLAGCTSLQLQSTSSTQVSSTTESSEAPLPRNVDMEGCKSAGSSFTFPYEVAPGEPVPGWPARTPDGTQPPQAFLTMVECKRVHWGGFDGPLAFIIEAHTNQNIVWPCYEMPATGTDSVSLWALHAFWVNNTSLASWLVATYDMPAKAANITAEKTVTASLNETTWSWVLPDGETSHVTFRHVTTGRVQDGADVKRVAWRGDYSRPLHLFDFFAEAVEQQGFGVITPGELGASTLYRQAAPNPYLGQGQDSDGGKFQGEIHRFSDLHCRDPF